MTDRGERILDDLYEVAAERLAPEAPYVIHPGEALGARYHPDAGLFDLAVWNLVVPFLVSLLATATPDWIRRLAARLRAGDEELLDSPSLAAARKELAAAFAALSQREIAALRQRMKPASTEIFQVATAFGLPAARAHRLTFEIEELLAQRLDQAEDEAG